MNTVALASAQRILSAAITKADQLGVPSHITVVDGGAHLVASFRQDEAPLVAIDSSFAKARTAVFFKTPTGDLVLAIQPGAPLYTIGSSTAEQLTFIAGGFPLVANGVVVGAIGAAGGAPDQDAAVAAAGAAAF